MIPRFNLGDNGDKRILNRATELKITMFKDTDGSVVGGFELHGHLGSDDDDEFFGGTAQADDLRFLAELIRSFQERVKD